MVETIENLETTQTEVVSTETQTEVETSTEWKAPTSPEELDTMIKAAVNKSNTEMLKALGVKSIKEFKEQKTEFETKYNELGNIVNERDEYQTKYQDLNNEIKTLKEETILNKLNIQEDYKNDLKQLALAQVTEEKNFEQVLTEMVTGRYKYATRGTSQVRMGTERNQTQQENSNVSPELAKKYPWLNK